MKMKLRIDKFTGGTYRSGKFDEIPVIGKINIKVKVKKEIELAKPVTALILYALRDLACGSISLGGLSSIGRGFLNGNEILIDGKSNNKFMEECIAELQKLRMGGAV